MASENNFDDSSPFSSDTEPIHTFSAPKQQTTAEMFSDSDSDSRSSVEPPAYHKRYLSSSSSSASSRSPSPNLSPPPPRSPSPARSPTPPSPSSSDSNSEGNGKILFAYSCLVSNPDLPNGAEQKEKVFVVINWKAYHSYRKYNTPYHKPLQPQSEYSHTHQSSGMSKYRSQSPLFSSSDSSAPPSPTYHTKSGYGLLPPPPPIRSSKKASKPKVKKNSTPSANKPSAKRIKTKTTEPLPEIFGQKKRLALAPATTRNGDKPRWQRQMNYVFMALCQLPECTGNRKDIIDRAVELDRTLSKQKGLPLAFSGKTPRNSASANLTHNTDGYFEMFFPVDSNLQHFRLTFRPNDRKQAIERYRKWEQTLYNKDWPIFFSDNPEQDQPSTSNSIPQAQPTQLQLPPPPPPKPEEPNGSLPAEVGTSDANSKDIAESNGTSQFLPSPTSLSSHEIPKHWSDIVEVKPSTIPNAGNGLFARRDLPIHTYLGFYFGVPMSEYSFDETKDKLGQASQYSIMYRYTVLDATNDEGLPFTDSDGEIYCPYHFMNHSSELCNVEFLLGHQINQIICSTTKHIKKGDELFVNYGDEVGKKFETPPQASPKPLALQQISQVYSSSPSP